MKRISSRVLKIIVYWAFRLLLVGAIITSIYTKEVTNLILAIITLLITYLPSLIEKKFDFDFPNEFEIIIIVFIYLSNYLGEIHLFYERFPFWDIFLHFISGILLGLVGIAFVYVLNREKNVSLKLSAEFIVLFAFMFAISLGAVWEIFEFTVDYHLDYNMQRYRSNEVYPFGPYVQSIGLVDTMWDLILDVLGAGVVSIIAYHYLKKYPNLKNEIKKKLKIR